MVKIDENFNHQSQNSQELLSTIFLSIGALTLVVSLFFGIKWKRFRYRMTFQNTPSENLIAIRRYSSTTEIRENCSEGKYRHSTTEELITGGNVIQPAIRTTSEHNVNLESSDRASIFRWPFRNKIKISSSKVVIDENRMLDYDEESVQRRERDSMLAEKNERLRRSIYERLNSTTSMPDLVTDSQSGTYQQKFEDPVWPIQERVELEKSHYQIVNEIHDTQESESTPVRVERDEVIDVSAHTFEMCKPKESNKIEIKNEDKNEVSQTVTPPKPPVRRRSKVSDLTRPERKIDDQDANKIPPAVKPRKRVTGLTVTIDPTANKIAESSSHQAEIQKASEEKSALKSDDVDSKKIELSATETETIFSPPLEYKDTSLVSIEHNKSSSSSLNIEKMSYEQDLTSNFPLEEVNQDAVAIHVLKSVDSIPCNSHDSPLPEVTEPNYPTTEDSPPIAKNRSQILLQTENTSAIMTPKSILKNKQQDTSQQPKSTVQFLNVPDSSSEDEDDFLDEDSNDVWSKIEIHRNQLYEFNRVYISSSSDDVPPPLPKTPPPTADIQERNFEFA